jgi:hypothetical protein
MRAFLLGATALAGFLALSGSANAACPVTGCPGGEPGTNPVKLTITVSGSGAVKHGAATLCGSGTCEVIFEEGESISLTAAAAAGQTFTGWSGACTGSGGCTIQMDTDRSVTATFADITPPAAPSITSPSAGAVIQSTTGGQTTVSFNDNGDTSTTSFRCRLDVNDVVSASACSSPWGTGSLSTGTHTVYVWARDAANNISGPASRTFKVVNLPETTLSGTPSQGAVVGGGQTAFTWSSPTGTSFDCTLDGDPVSCAADLDVEDGPHTLEVSAGVSPFGDGIVYSDTTPASRSWTVDSVPPDTSISTGPPTATTDRSATLTFSGADPAPGTAMTYECRLDGGQWSRCDSGEKQLSSLALGPHRFEVRATDAAGNLDPSPAIRDWNVIADSDGDGIFTPADCDDANGAIHPGAADPPGDGIDQDCSGADAPSPARQPTQGGSGGGGAKVAPGIAAALRAKWMLGEVGTAVRRLIVTRLPAGAKLRVRCRGAGCPFAQKRLATSRGRADLTRLFAESMLKPGARIELRIDAAGMAPQVIEIQMRSGRKPKISLG